MPCLIECAYYIEQQENIHIRDRFLFCTFLYIPMLHVMHNWLNQRNLLYWRIIFLRFKKKIFNWLINTSIAHLCISNYNLNMHDARDSVSSRAPLAEHFALDLSSLSVAFWIVAFAQSDRNEMKTERELEPPRIENAILYTQIAVWLSKNY